MLKTLPEANVTVFTIGHSTHPEEKFSALLRMHGIQLLVDVRSFPGSRRWPQFNREHLASILPSTANARYLWLPGLGGRRKTSCYSPDTAGWTHPAFRSYAEYMKTPEFESAAQQLLELAGGCRTAIMCSEGLWWRCHRRMISDHLVVHGVSVLHIMPSGELRPHELTAFAVIINRRLSYPAMP